MQQTESDVALRRLLAGRVGCDPDGPLAHTLADIVARGVPLLYAGLMPGRWAVVSFRFEAGRCVKIRKDDAEEIDLREPRRAS